MLSNIEEWEGAALGNMHLKVCMWIDTCKALVFFIWQKMMSLELCKNCQFDAHISKECELVRQTIKTSHTSSYSVQ